MATIVNTHPKKNDLGTALGIGISQGLSNVSKVELKKIIEDRAREEFQKKLSMLKEAGGRQQALQMVLTGGIAGSPDEVIKLTSAVDALYPQQKRESTDVFDKETGTTVKLNLTSDEINSPEALRETFGDRFRLASEGERKSKTWVDSKNGEYIQHSTGRPRSRPNAIPLEVFKEQQDIRESTTGGKIDSDVFDDQGNIKNAAQTTIRKSLQLFLSESHPETGVPTNPDPDLMSKSLARVNAEVFRRKAAGEPINLGLIAANSAMQTLKEAPPSEQIPLSTKAKQELGDRTVYMEEGIMSIDRQLLKMGAGVGVVSGLQQLVDYVTGATELLGAPLVFADNVKNRAALRLLSRTLQVALADPGDDRISDSERAIIQELIPSPDNWLEHPEQAAEEMRVLRDWMATKRQFAIRRLGLQGARPLPSREDSIRSMPEAELRYLNWDLLSESEKRALDQRIQNMGFK